MIKPTVENLNAILKLYASDSVGRKHLRQDWRNVMTSRFQLDTLQRENLAALLPKRINSIQSALNRAMRSGGNLRIVEENPGICLLMVEPPLPHPRYFCGFSHGSFLCREDDP
jgi:hypothetical protein